MLKAAFETLTIARFEICTLKAVVLRAGEFNLDGADERGDAPVLYARLKPPLGVNCNLA